jgi:hypothetical protein
MGEGDMKAAVLAFVLAGGVVIGLAVAAGGPPAPVTAEPASSSQEQEPPVVCGLRNASYAGLCEERTPYVKGKKLEALCKPILDCLNDTRCIKTYCGSTTVRQGWVLESAAREKKQEGSAPW